MVKFDCWRTRKPRALRDAVQAEQPSMHRDEERQTRRFNNRALKRRLGLAASLFALSSGACLQPVSAQSSEVEQTGERGSENWFTDLTQEMSPSLVALLGAGALAAASLAWGARTSAGTRRTMASWSKKLATMEAELDDTRAVLSAYRGLILIWADDQSDAAIDEAWGEPRLLGGAAALASLMSFAGSDGNGETAIARLLNAIGDLDLFDAHTNEPAPLKRKVSALRQHGVPFAGVIRTTEGRSIEAEGVVAGGQVTLWLADPATKVAESGDLLGSARQNAEDLHGALHLLQNTPVPAWRRSGDGRIIWANTAYLEAVEAKSLSVVCNDQIELDSAVRRLAEKARVDRTAVEAPVSVNVSGERKIFRVTEQPTHTGEDAGLCGMALDITELEATRTTLTEHIETNRRTLDQIPVAVAIFGVNTELSYYNLAFKELWGLETAELDAKPPHGEVLDKLRHNGRLPEQADYRGWRAKQLEIYTEETPPGVDRTGAAPDEVWSLADGRTLRVARARHPLGGLVIVFEDITEKLRFEALHNTQIKVQRATLNNLSEGVATFGADGRLRLANDSFRQLWRMDESFLSKLPHVEAVLKRMRAFTADGGEALNLVRRRITSMTAEDRTSTSEQQLALTDGRTLSFGTEP
ncbi:MAG: PAS-domain containing protein, partial [Pseudomonadota bacterium]